MVYAQFNDLCKLGDLDGLELLIEKYGPHIDTRLGIGSASLHGHIHVLEWWKQMVIQKKITKGYNELAIIFACLKGHVNVLEWWKKASGLKLIYDDSAITGASRKGHVDVLDWWHQNSEILKLKIDSNIVLESSKYRQIAVLDWWYEKRYTYVVHFEKASEEAIKYAIRHGYTDVLNWWYDNGFDLKYSNDTLLDASRGGYVDILDWLFRKSFLAKQFEEIANSAIRVAMMDGFADVLDWWRLALPNAGLLNGLFGNGIVSVLTRGHVNVLDWLMKHDTKFNKNIAMMMTKGYFWDNPLDCIHDKSIEWLTKNGFLDKSIYEKIIELYDREEHDEIINLFIKV